MYQLTPLKFHPDQVAHLLGLALSLNLQPGPGGAGMTDSALTLETFWPVLMGFLPGRWANTRVVGLWPSQQIPLHADTPIAAIRHHIPLQLNRRCMQFTENANGVLICQHLEEGQDYTLDPTLPHGAVNWGSELRLHLMIDVEAQ